MVATTGKDEGEGILAPMQSDPNYEADHAFRRNFWKLWQTLMTAEETIHSLKPVESDTVPLVRKVSTDTICPLINLMIFHGNSRYYLSEYYEQNRATSSCYSCYYEKRSHSRIFDEYFRLPAKESVDEDLEASEAHDVFHDEFFELPSVLEKQYHELWNEYARSQLSEEESSYILPELELLSDMLTDLFMHHGKKQYSQYKRISHRFINIMESVYCSIDEFIIDHLGELIQRTDDCRMIPASAPLSCTDSNINSNFNDDKADDNETEYSHETITNGLGQPYSYHDTYTYCNSDDINMITDKNETVISRLLSPDISVTGDNTNDYDDNSNTLNTTSDASTTTTPNTTTTTAPLLDIVTYDRRNYMNIIDDISICDVFYDKKRLKVRDMTCNHDIHDVSHKNTYVQSFYNDMYDKNMIIYDEFIIRRFDPGGLMSIQHMIN